jgi:vacuolar-type H+-ATPase subunit C/Vma6
VDLTNLLWAMRYRIYYGLSEEEIINYTLPFGYRVHDDDLRSMAAGGSLARTIERIYPEIRDVESLLEAPERGLPKLELHMLKSLRAYLHGVFSGYPFHVGLPIALVLLNELEVQDLSVWIEAKAAAIPADVFEPYLLMDTKTVLSMPA